MGLSIQQREALRQYTPEQIQTLKQTGRWDAAKQSILSGAGPIPIQQPTPASSMTQSGPVTSIPGQAQVTPTTATRTPETTRALSPVPASPTLTAPSSPPPSSPPVYTFKEKSNGNVEIYKNGQRIATGTAQYAEQFGYKEPKSSSPGAAPNSPSSIQSASPSAAQDNTVTRSPGTASSTAPQNAPSQSTMAPPVASATTNATTSGSKTPTAASTTTGGGASSPTAAPSTTTALAAPSAPPAATASTPPAPYTFQKQPDGTLAVYQNGRLVSSSASPDAAAKYYGYTPSTPTIPAPASVPMPYTFVENYSGSQLLTVGVYQNGKLVSTDAPDTASSVFGFRQDQNGTYQTARGAGATNLRTTSEVLSFPQTSDGLSAITAPSNAASTPQAPAYSPPEIPPASGLTPSITETDTFFLTNPDGTIAIYKHGTLALPKVDPAYAAQNYGYVLPGTKSNSGQAAPASSGLPTCPALATGPSGLPSCTNGQYVFVPTANNTVEVFQNGQNLAAGMSASTAATKYGYATSGSDSQPPSAIQTPSPSQGVIGAPIAPTPYTFQQTSDGNVAIYKNGQKISTGTPQYAAQYGYSGPGSNTPPAALNNPNYALSNPSPAPQPAAAPTTPTPPAPSSTPTQNNSPTTTQSTGAVTGTSPTPTQATPVANGISPVAPSPSAPQTFYIQSGTGAKLTADQIRSGTFPAGTYFIESGTGRQVTQDELAAGSQPSSSTPGTPQSVPSSQKGGQSSPGNAPSSLQPSSQIITPPVSSGLSASDTAWANKLPNDLRQQVLALTPSQVDEMKRNGTWLQYQLDTTHAGEAEYASQGKTDVLKDTASELVKRAPGAAIDVASLAIPGDAEIESVALAAKSAEELLSETKTAESLWRSADALTEHFSEHGTDFGATSASDYAQKAADFLQEAQTKGYLIKVDERGVIRIYDPTTNTFGAFNSNGTVRTFFRPANGASYWSGQPGEVQ